MILVDANQIAISHLMGDAVQNDIDKAMEFAHATSLDGERKIAADKKNENPKLLSLARASGNSILREYRLKRERATQRRFKAARLAKQKHTSLRALALHFNPDLVKTEPGAAGQPPKLCPRRTTPVSLHPKLAALLWSHNNKVR